MAKQFCCTALLTITLMLMPTMCTLASDGNHRDFSPKTPEAAAFEKVAEVPVGNYTGIPNISIPLYTVECGDLQLPISLDYQGTAIRVDQEATWVGLNWILNAGGAVTTRLSPNSINDEPYPGYYNDKWDVLLNQKAMTKIYPDGGEFNQSIYYKLDGMHPTWRGRFGYNWFSKSAEVIDSNNASSIDLPSQLYAEILTRGEGESPTYNANFLGHNVSFIWDRIQNEFFITGNAEGFKIEGNYRFGPTIIDGNGNKYVFQALEIGQAEGTDVDPIFNRLDYTYYLSKIVSPAGDSIILGYMNHGVTHPVYKVNETIYDKSYPVKIVNNINSKSLVNRWVTVGDDNSNHIRTLSQYYMLWPLRLHTISTNGMVVRFNLSSQKRKDICGTDYGLDNIEVCRKNSNGSETLLKRFKFQYGYFDKATTGGNTLEDMLGSTYSSWFANDDFMYYRLKLEKVWEETVDNGSTKKKPAYQFVYASPNLPCKASAAVDYWGYYNGCENSNGTWHTLIPKPWNDATDDDAYHFPDTYIKASGADRRFNKNNAGACMLQSITYPTGGVASFTYEPHTFSNMDYFDATKTSKYIQFNSRKVYTCNAPNYTLSGNNTYEGSVEFTISSTSFFSLDVCYVKNNLQSQAYWLPLLANVVELIKYKNYSSTATESCTVFNLTPSDTLTSNNMVNKDNTFELEPGRYKLMIVSLQNKQYPEAFYQITAQIRLEHSGFESVGAGLRIKSISSSDANGNVTETSYSYTKNDGSTSGILMAPAIYNRQKLLIFQNNEVQVISGQTVNPPKPKEINYWMISGDNLAATATTSVGYSRVTVTKTGGTDSNGESIYEYYNKRWGSGTLFDFLRRIEDPRNGKLLTQYDYDASGHLVRQTYNSYQIACVDSRTLNVVMENIYFGPNAITKEGLVSENAYAEVLGGGCMQTYIYPSVQFSLTKTTTQVSDYVGEQYLSRITETTYNQTNHLEAAIKENSSRSNESTLTEILYPSDFADSYTAIKLLKDAHIINVPVETVKSVTYAAGQYVADAERTDYNSMGLPATIWQLKSVPLARSSFPLSNTTASYGNYEKAAEIVYNEAGRPRMVTEYDNLPTTYVWGYNNQYPVAVVKGATASQVLSTAFSSNAATMKAQEAALTPSMSAVALHTKLSSISGALVTTYEFNPYVGMVKMIAPNGETTTFDYDTFARLVKITDHGGIVSGTFQYHYKNE